MKRMVMCFTILLCVGLLIGPGVSVAYANTFPGLSVRGTLTDLQGVPKEGLTSVTVRIYALPTGGTSLYGEEFTALLTGGVLDLILGVGGGIPSGDLVKALTPSPEDVGPITRFLGVAWDGGPEVEPRTRLTGEFYAAFAASAGDAGRLGGKTASQYATSAELAALSEVLADVTSKLARICHRFPRLCDR